MYYKTLTSVMQFRLQCGGHYLPYMNKLFILKSTILTQKFSLVFNILNNVKKKLKILSRRFFRINFSRKSTSFFFYIYFKFLVCTIISIVKTFFIFSVGSSLNKAKTENINVDWWHEISKKNSSETKLNIRIIREILIDIIMCLSWNRNQSKVTVSVILCISNKIIQKVNNIAQRKKNIIK